MELLHDTYTWIIFSFALFVLVAWKFGRGPVLSMLDSKIATIRREISAAEHLRAEANALLLEFEQRQRMAQQEADRLVSEARDQAEIIRQREEKNLDEMMRRKEQQLLERLDLLRDQAIDEIRHVAATLAFDATKKMVASKLDDDSRNKLVERALDQVAQRLN